MFAAWTIETIEKGLCDMIVGLEDSENDVKLKYGEQRLVSASTRRNWMRQHYSDGCMRVSLLESLNFQILLAMISRMLIPELDPQVSANCLPQDHAPLG